MGTTLTGLTPATTYDALIKVGDNGPLSATAKLLTDGLGNDSVLYLGTAGLGIKATSVLSFNINDATHSVGYDSVIDGSQLRGQNGVRFSTGSGGGTERMRITSAGNVGIGTSLPNSFSKLDVDGQVLSRGNIILSPAQSYRFNNYYNSATVTDKTVSTGFAGRIEFNTTSGFLSFNTSSASVSAGNDVSLSTRVRIDSDGLKFGSDTAAANALDDYEEGTWTMGVSFGGASVGITYAANAGTYTKVGRQVTVNGLLALTSKGSSTGGVRITGLPFTVGSLTSNYSASTLRFKNISFVNQYQGYCDPSTTTVVLEESTNLGVVTAVEDTDFANNSEVIISLTYFV